MSVKVLKSSELHIWPLWLRHFVFFLCFYAAIGCTPAVPQANTARPAGANIAASPDASLLPSITNLSSDSIPALTQLPYVANIFRHDLSGKPAYRIIHIADWHLVKKEAFAADHRAMSTQPITDEEIEHRYAAHIADVEKMQKQQIEVLRVFIRTHGITRFFIEGLSEEGRDAYGKQIAVTKSIGQQIAKLVEQHDELLASGVTKENLESLAMGISELEKQYRLELLDIGAIGRLLINDEIESALPLESPIAYDAANPVHEDGTVSFDPMKNDTREDAQVRILMDNGPFSVVILGGAHDLSDNLDRLTLRTAEYLRVELEAWKDLAGSSGK